MDTRQIKTLLEKYFDGMTSLEEDQILFGYFSGKDVAEELLPHRDHFRLLQAGRDPMVPDHSFEEKLAGLLSDPVVLPSAKPAVRLFPRIAAAAAVAVLIGASVLFVARNSLNNNRDTYSDPQLAYQETRKTLLYISQTMNKGMEPLQNVNKINTGTRHLQSLKKMDSSLGMLNMVSFINNSSNLKK